MREKDACSSFLKIFNSSSLFKFGELLKLILFFLQNSSIGDGVRSCPVLDDLKRPVDVNLTVEKLIRESE